MGMAFSIITTRVVSKEGTRRSPHRRSSTGTPGRGVTSDPVAMMMFLVASVVVAPSAVATSTSVGLRSLPHPCTYCTCKQWPGFGRSGYMHTQA